MASLFSKYSKIGQAPITSIMGEAVSIVPRLKAGQFAVGAEDPDRDAIDVVGVPTFTQDDANLEGARRGGDPRGFTTLGNRVLAVWFSESEYQKIGYSIRQGDALIMKDRSLSQLYSVVDAKTSDQGDVTVTVNIES